MSTFNLVVTIVLGVGALVTFFVLLPARWVAYRYPEARSALTAVRRLLQERESLSSPEAKALDRDLADLVRDLRDPRLRGHVERVLSEYRHAFASRPDPFFFIGGDIAREDPEADRRAGLHQAHQNKALDGVEEALQWMRKVEFFRLHPKT